MAVDETLLRGRAGLKAHISPSDLVAQASSAASPGGERPAAKAATGGAEPDYQPPAKKSDPLPKPGDPYRACARFLNRLSTEQRVIHFVMQDFACEGFSYHDLRRVRLLPGDAAGSGPVLVLRFVEAVISEVRIEGRNLDDMHYWISEGCMPWVWEQPKGFTVRNDAATVITRITLTETEK
jgi:hypothetical protein